MKEIKDGGDSRDKAFIDFFLNTTDTFSILYNKKNLYHILLIIVLLLFSRNKKIILHQNSIFIPVSGKNIVGKIGRKFYVFLVKFTSLNNELVYEINDLPVEQAIDLELEVPYYFSEIENKIYNLKNIKFIFASEEMKKYVKSKYNIEEIRTYVCLNGSKDYTFKNNNIKIDSEFINIVYAGTLNQGRNIENMIKIIKKNLKLRLFLIGKFGNWIDVDNFTNIFYLGEKEEEEAFNLVSKCDIGLIPYDNSRFYYNLAFPTKVSFYLTGGIPYLGTQTKELINFEKKNPDLGYLVGESDWENFFNRISKSELIEKKKNIIKTKEKFYWNNILKKCFQDIGVI